MREILIRDGFGRGHVAGVQKSVLFQELRERVVQNHRVASGEALLQFGGQPVVPALAVVAERGNARELRKRRQQRLPRDHRTGQSGPVELGNAAERVGQVGAETVDHGLVAHGTGAEVLIGKCAGRAGVLQVAVAGALVSELHHHTSRQFPLHIDLPLVQPRRERILVEVADGVADVGGGPFGGAARLQKSVREGIRQRAGEGDSAIVGRARAGWRA